MFQAPEVLFQLGDPHTSDSRDAAEGDPILSFDVIHAAPTISAHAAWHMRPFDYGEGSAAPDEVVDSLVDTSDRRSDTRR